MVETAVHDQKVGFSDFAENLDEVRTSLTEVVRQLPIDTETTATILLSIENNIKTLLKNLADKTEIGWGIDTDPEDFSHLPNSITGVIIYYVTKGIKEDFGYEFETEPKSLKVRGLSKDAKKIAGKKRLLTRDQKNELIAQTEMSRAVAVASRELYEESGVELVEWLVADPCDLCQENADVSPIRIDETFPSGDTEPPAHPNCVCDIAPYVVDTRNIGEDALSFILGEED